MKVIDGTIDWSGGQNSGLTPDRIGKNQFERGINTSCKNGSIKPRPRLLHIPVKVVTLGSEGGRSYQHLFDLGKFQGERAFTDDVKSFAITVRSGIIFKVDYTRGIATVIRHGTDDRIGLRHRRVCIKPAGMFIVIHDWPNNPIIITGDFAARSNFYAKDNAGIPVPEIPQSVLGVFVQSRYWIANSTNEFTAGDFVGDRLYPDAPITFGEVFLPGGPFVGQAFNLGYGFGHTAITAMGFISSRNSQSKIQATKYGPLYVATKRSIHVYDAELPRVEWAKTAFGRIELSGTGIVGERAHTIIGSDILFQSALGDVHSFSKNQNDERSGWATTIISREVDDWLETVNKDYLGIGFITFFDKVVLVGARPIRIPIKGYRGQTIYDYAHEGMVALELDNVSTIATPASPVWAGLWTGIRPMEASVVDNDLYVVSKDVDGYNRTYRLDENAIYDTCNNTKRAVKGRLYTRSFDFETPFADKTEHSLDLNIGDVEGELELTAYRKPLHSSTFAKWNTYVYTEECEEVCGVDGGSFAPNDPVGYRVLSFGDPVENPNNTANGEDGKTFRETQVMLEFRAGEFTLFKLKIRAEGLEEADSDGTVCTAKVQQQPKAQCNLKDDWSFYSIAPRVGDDD